MNSELSHFLYSYSSFYDVYSKVEIYKTALLYSILDVPHFAISCKIAKMIQLVKMCSNINKKTYRFES